MTTETSTNPPLIKGSCPLLHSEDSDRFRLGAARLDETAADDCDMHADTERDREEVDEDADVQYSELGGYDDTDRGRSDDDSPIIIQGGCNSPASEDERDVPEKG